MYSNNIDKRGKEIVAILITLLLLGSIFIFPTTLAQTNQENTTEDPTRQSQAFITENITDFGSDITEDGLFDYLIIEVTIKIVEPGMYQLGTKLLLGEDQPSIYVYKEFEAEDEFIVISLRFNGEHIYAAGELGYYTCSLWLEDQKGVTISQMDHKTNEYRHTDFTHPPPPIILTDKFRAYGQDRDQDKLFDFLTIEIGVEIIEPGYYLVLFGLFKESELKEENPEEKTTNEEVREQTEDEPFYYLITYTYIISYYSEGNNSLKLHFDGPDVRLSKLNGTYLVGLRIERINREHAEIEKMPPEERERFEYMLKEHLFWPMADEGDLSGEAVYKTREFSYEDFDKPIPIVTFSKPNYDRAVDLDNDRYFEFLQISVSLNVSEPGKYLLEGMIETDDTVVKLWAENLTHLRIGNHRVLLRFKGVEIHKSGLDGNYIIMLIIKGETISGLPVLEKRKYQTKNEYNHLKFESSIKDDDYIEPSDDSQLYAIWDREGVRTKTDIIEVFTTQARPELTFWYTDSEENGAKFKLVYNDLIGYRDINNNGMYDFGEERYIANLGDNFWNINEFTNSVNSEYGNYVEFELSSDLNLYNIEKLRDTENIEQKRYEEYVENQPDFTKSWVTLVFKFLITSNDFIKTEPLEYKINGRTELKIDVELKFYRPLDIDGICLIQFLFDETKSYGFKTKEADGDNIFYQNKLRTERNLRDDLDMHLFEPRAGDLKQWIMFIDDTEKEFGFYSWVNSINITYYDGTSEVIHIHTTYTFDGSILRLYTNYPYENELSEIHHDPSIGMIKESKPTQKAAVNGLAEILFNPWLYIISCVVAVVILFAVRKSQMRRKIPQRHYQNKQRSMPTTHPRERQVQRLGPRYSSSDERLRRY